MIYSRQDHGDAPVQAADHNFDTVRWRSDSHYRITAKLGSGGMGESPRPCRNF